MKKFREGQDRNQVEMFPRRLEEYVGPRDLTRYVDTLVDQLDLSAIESFYSRLGRPGYHPRMLVKLLVYGKLRGIASSRELAEAARENVRFMFLTKNERPDFRTVSDFRKRHHLALAELLSQTIAIGVREELIDLKRIAVDGTKLQAFAGRNSFKSPVTIEAELKSLEEELVASLAKDIASDDDEDRHHGDDDGMMCLTEQAQDKAVLKEKLQKALGHYNSIGGHKRDKPKGVSLTDPECRYMHSKGVNPGYNAQIAVDAKHHFAVGGFITTACGDSSQLIPVVEDVRARTGKLPEVVIADRGYTNLEAIAELERLEVDAYVSLTDYNQNRPQNVFQYNIEADSFTCREERTLTPKTPNKNARTIKYQSATCEGCSQIDACMPAKPPPGTKRIFFASRFQSSVERMKLKIASPTGLEMRRLRSSTVEPVFGTIKHAMRFRQFTVRGRAFVDSIWKFQLAAYNIAKLARIFQLQSNAATQ